MPRDGNFAIPESAPLAAERRKDKKGEQFLSRHPNKGEKSEYLRRISGDQRSAPPLSPTPPLTLLSWVCRFFGDIAVGRTAAQCSLSLEISAKLVRNKNRGKGSALSPNLFLPHRFARPNKGEKALPSISFLFLLNSVNPKGL